MRTGRPHLVLERPAHDSRVPVVADGPEVEDGDSAERHVQRDVDLAERGAHEPPLAQLQQGAR